MAHIDSIEIKLNEELTLIDTPGLVNSGDIINYIDANLIKKVIPNKEIKPITYQVKSLETIYVDNLVRIVLSNNNITMYVSNGLDIKRTYKEDIDNSLECHIIDVKPDNDIVIEGLGFVKFTKSEQVRIYTLKGVNVYKRNSLI